MKPTYSPVPERIAPWKTLDADLQHKLAGECGFIRGLAGGLKAAAELERRDAPGSELHDRLVRMSCDLAAFAVRLPVYVDFDERRAQRLELRASERPEQVEALLRFAHDLARYAVEAAEVLDDPELLARLGDDQARKLRGVFAVLASSAEQLVDRRPLPMLLEVMPATPAELMERIGRAHDALNRAYGGDDV